MVPYVLEHSHQASERRPIKVQCNLSQYTKADLLWIINRAYQLGLDEIYIRRALGDLKQKHFNENLEEADQLNALAHDKRMEYINLMGPYEGWKIKDIPLEVLEKADAALREAGEADRKWRRLMMRKNKC